MENNYFEEYKKAKVCLYKMVGQFLDYYLPIEMADSMNIKYKKSDIKMGNSIKVLFHNYREEGIRAWDLLNIGKPIITRDELWKKEKEVKTEEENKNIDYYKEYLKTCILIIDMTTMYYSTKVDTNNAKKVDIKYNPFLDELDERVSVCNHYWECAGESVWKLLGVEDEIVGKSIFDNKRNMYSKKLLTLECDKVKRLEMLNNNSNS